MEGFYDECLDASSGVYRYFQDGAWKTSSSGTTVKIINPSTNQPAFSVQGAHEARLPPPPAWGACTPRYSAVHLCHRPMGLRGAAMAAIAPTQVVGGRSTGHSRRACDAALPACSLHPC
jgi:hypothetical protein